MKIILSRKGFDSSAGGLPSPILPDGTLLSIPIPDSEDLIKYSELKHNKDTSYYDILSQLAKEHIKLGREKLKLDLNTTCHLDPDLNHCTIKRQKGWKPLFGQTRAAQTHLNNNGIEVGDVFLFFGWFRNTVINDDKLQYDKKDKEGKHIIYGYFQIGDIIKTNDLSKEVDMWIKSHPHFIHEKRRNTKNNTIYVASDFLSWNKYIKGAGSFRCNQSLVLTKEGYKRSQWQLPKFFRNVNMTFHNQNSFKDDYFKCVDRGQEFVIEENEDVFKWAKNLIEKNYNN